MSRIRCQSCGKENDSSSNFCIHCGSKIKKEESILSCQSCGKENDSSSNFCIHCGSKIKKEESILSKLRTLFIANRTPQQSYYKFNNVKGDINKFNQILSNKKYIDKSTKNKLKNDNRDNYNLCLDLKRNYTKNIQNLELDELNLINLFLKNYENIDKIVKGINKLEIDDFYNEFKDNKDNYQLFIEKYKNNVDYDNLITDDIKDDLKKDYEFLKVLICFEKSDGYDFGEDSKLIHDFVELYENFDKVKDEINTLITTRKNIVSNFKNNKNSILEFIDKFKNNLSYDTYINDYTVILNDYRCAFKSCDELSKLPESYHEDIMNEFLEIYNNFDKITEEININYLKQRYAVFSNIKDEIIHQIEKYNSLNVDLYLDNKESFLKNYSKVHESLLELKKYHYEFDKDNQRIVTDFLRLYDDFNGGFPNKIYNSFLNFKSILTRFLNKYGDDFECVEYIFDKKDILKTYETTYINTKDVVKLNNSNELDLSKNDIKQFRNFINLFDNFDSIVEKNNNCYVEKLNNEFLSQKNSLLEFIEDFNKNNLLTYYIDDKNKLKILKTNEKYYDLSCKLNKIPETTNNTASEFIDIYENFDEVIFSINKNYVTTLYENNLDKIDEYVSIINLTQNYYISNSKLNGLLEDYNYYAGIVLKLLEYCSDYEYLLDKTKLLEFPINSDELIHITSDANDEFIKRELKEHKKLFDTVVPEKPLDQCQRKAVVIDEDNTQIIAGAGCGKTLTLQAKAKYLIETKNVKQDEILAISFSNFSADDLERKMNEIGLDIDVSTFHSLGLDILRKNKVRAKVEEYALKNAIKRYFAINLLNNDEMLKKIIEYFGYFMYEPLDKNKIENIGEVYDYERGMDLETLYSKFEKLRDPTLKKTSLRGEKVKSLEERKIANFLFINGINYTYEKEYEAKIDWKKTRDFLDKFILNDIEIPKFIKKNLIGEILEFLEIDETLLWPNTVEEVVKYHPDFYLDDYDIYYEHFGVNRKCIAPWLPKRNRMKYKKEMRNKQILHRRYGTTLIETYSYYQSENRLLERLSEKLQEKGVQFKKLDYKKFMIDLLHDEEKINEYWDFIKLVETFINLFKGNGYGKEKFNEFRKINHEKFKDFKKQKHEMFLDIVEDIYDYYYNYLNEHKLIDFNDMINDATEKVKENGYYKNYKYIMVDEYQDTSHTRFNLLKAIKDELNAKLIVVGDDWQSIYRFTGCDIDLFTDFENYFENSKTEVCYITNTYRNSQSLIDVSGNFIMENDAQFKKELNSKADEQIEDTIKLYQYLNFLEQPFVFEAIIQDIYKSSDKNHVNILVLGRNRKDYLSIINDELFFTTGSIKDKNLKIHYTKNHRISIRYMTVHGSKGLEEDNVVLINLEDKKNGFPNKMEDDSVLNFVKNEKEEPIDFAEERRLFYVALTRTLKRTYLLASKDKKSQFVSELMDDIEVVDFELDLNEPVGGDEIRTVVSTDGICPDCGTGKINLKYNPQTGKSFFKCSNWPRCDWFGGRFWGNIEELDNVKICPDCGGILIRKWSEKNQEHFLGCINYYPYKVCRYSEDIND